MNDSREQQAPSLRVCLCGAFRVERRVGNGYEGVRTAEYSLLPRGTSN
jgi:hypothetical protein